MTDNDSKFNLSLRERCSAGERGFTFVELVIVVAVIAIMAAVSIPKFADLIVKSQNAAVHGDLGSIRSAISIYYSENEGLFPRGSLAAALTTEERYLPKIPTCRVPRLHNRSGVINDNDSMGLAGLDTADDGTWCYHNYETDSAYSKQGDFWVGCTHADTKGSIWSAY